MNYVLLSLFGLSLVALAVVGLVYGERQRQYRMEEKADHAKCIAHISSVTSKRFLADHLDYLADEVDSMEELETFARIRFKHTPAGPSVISMWLSEKAKEIRP